MMSQINYIILDNFFVNYCSKFGILYVFLMFLKNDKKHATLFACI